MQKFLLLTACFYCLFSLIKMGVKRRQHDAGRSLDLVGAVTSGLVVFAMIS